MTKICKLCGTGSLEFLDSPERVSVSDSKQVLPLAKVAAETQFLRDLEGRNYAAFDALAGFPAVSDALRFLCGSVEMRCEAIPLGEN